MMLPYLCNDTRLLLKHTDSNITELLTKFCEMLTISQDLV